MTALPYSVHWQRSAPLSLPGLPPAIFLLGLFVAIDPAVSFAVSVLLSAIALFGLGAAKVLVTERSWLRSGLELLLVGGLAAAVAYLIGIALSGLGA
jgi:VIT1/CCC1 family predicted Fe2+/Mn2+ transporter